MAAGFGQRALAKCMLAGSARFFAEQQGAGLPRIFQCQVRREQRGGIRRDCFATDAEARLGRAFAQPGGRFIHRGARGVVGRHEAQHRAFETMADADFADDRAGQRVAEHGGPGQPEKFRVAGQATGGGFNANTRLLQVLRVHRLKARVEQFYRHESQAAQPVHAGKSLRLGFEQRRPAEFLDFPAPQRLAERQGPVAQTGLVVAETFRAKITGGKNGGVAHAGFFRSTSAALAPAKPELIFDMQRNRVAGCGRRSMDWGATGSRSSRCGVQQYVGTCSSTSLRYVWVHVG